ncbi:MAG TPA: helix-turn-helix domain-containing protein [Candidatus Limnocylindria bacterium]|nr:helix-turn-helix domain-containing protein [Candidatus Limnocylindria bacterium]
MRAADVVRAARAHAGLTQRALAARAGVPQPTVAAIESGRQDPRYRTLERLVRACGQELDLLPGAGDGVDRTQFRATLRLSPSRRLARAAEGARALHGLRAARPVRDA